MPFRPVKQPKCAVCGKTAYVTERFELEGEVYHKRCFRCSHCNCSLTMSSYAMIDSKPYCKPHYKQLFLSAGGSFDKAFNAGLSKKAKEEAAKKAEQDDKKPAAHTEEAVKSSEPVAESPAVTEEPAKESAEPVSSEDQEAVAESHAETSQEPTEESVAEAESQAQSTSENTQEPTEEPVAQAESQAESNSEESAVTEEPAEDASVADLTKATSKWSCAVDDDSGDKYYINNETGEAVWEKPVEFEE